MGLPVSIVPVSELSFREFAPLLGLQAKRCDWASFESLQADLFSCLVTEAVRAFLDACQGGIDLPEELALAVPRTQFQPEFGFLRCPVIRIREIGRLILHVMYGSIDFEHEFTLPGAQDFLEMVELSLAHVFLAPAWIIRIDSVNRA